MRYMGYCCIRELNLSGGREIIYVELWVIKFQKSSDWWELRKKTCWWNLKSKTWDLRDWRARESPWRILAKIQDVPDLDQHRCNFFSFLRCWCLTYLHFFFSSFPFSISIWTAFVFILSFSCGYYAVSSVSVSTATRLAYDIYCLLYTSDAADE